MYVHTHKHPNTHLKVWLDYNKTSKVLTQFSPHISVSICNACTLVQLAVNCMLGCILAHLEMQENPNYDVIGRV